MIKRLFNSLLLFSFLLLSFSSTVCLCSKMNYQDISVLVNVVEEEDETEKDSKDGLDEFIEIDRIQTPDLTLQNSINSFSNNWFIELIVSKISTPPPKQLAV